MIHIIANKTAGHGVAGKILDSVREYLDSRNIVHTVWETESPGHATYLAVSAAEQGAKCVFALGGDGTVSEVARGMRGTNVPMGIIPAGTGNDIAKAVKLPLKPIPALEQSLRNEPRRLDMGIINDRTFTNVIGTGFDVETLQWTEKFKRGMRGIIPYLLGVICTIATHRDINIRLTVDGVERRISALLIAVANGTCIGGGMQIAPDAKVDDGLFDVTIIHPVSKWKIPFLLPKFLSGKIKTIKYAEDFRCTNVKIESLEPGQIMDIDGELIPMDVVNVEIDPGGVLIKA